MTKKISTEVRVEWVNWNSPPTETMELVNKNSKTDMINMLKDLKENMRREMADIKNNQNELSVFKNNIWNGIITRWA